MTAHRAWRWWVRGIARVLITIGLLMLGFIVYQLWGTGIEHARAQDELERAFDKQLASTVLSAATTTVAPPVSTSAPAPSTTPTTAAPTTPPPTTVAPATAPPTTVALVTAPPVTPPPRPDFAEGDPVAKLEIPRIGLDEIVVAGVGVDDLKKGPGHYPGTPLPGEPGNAAIAGHRTTYGAPFFDIDDLEAGDEIVATTYAGRFVYRVSGTVVVPPDEVAVVGETPDDRLTLTSCDPKYSATNRIVLTAAFDPSASSPIAGALPPASAPAVSSPPDTAPAAPIVTTAAATTAVATTTTTPTTTTTAVIAPVIQAAPTTAEAALDPSTGHGWFDDNAAWPHVLLWALVAASVVLGAWWLSRISRQWWLGALVGATPFIVALYFFYENVNRLLPPNI